MTTTARNNKDHMTNTSNSALNETKCYDAAVEIVKYTLSILEERRKTIVARANVLLTANAVLIAGMLALFSSDVPWARAAPTRLLLLGAAVCAAASIFFTLGMIRVLPPTRREEIRDDDLVHFRRLAMLSGPEYVTMISTMNREDALRLYAEQACGLSKLLENRYRALDNGHKGFLTALSIFLIGLGWGIVTTLCQ